MTINFLSKYFSNFSSTTLIIFSIIFIFFIGIIDYYTGIEFSFSIFYLLPISITSWYVGKRAGIVVSFISAIIWFWADIAAGHIYSSTLILIWNTVMRLSLFIIISTLLSNFKSQMKILHQDELIIQKNNIIIETFQKLTILIVNNITAQNAEIIKWVNESKEKKIDTPEIVEKSSRVIGESLQVLSEASFVNPYTSESLTDADKYLSVLKKRLNQVKKEITAYDKTVP